MSRIIPRVLIALLLTVTGGCAATCHDNSCASCASCVPYTYCPPLPLPYRTYRGCPTPVAACYSASRQVVALDANDTLQSPLPDPPASAPNHRDAIGWTGPLWPTALKRIRSVLSPGARQLSDFTPVSPLVVQVVARSPA